MSFFLLWRGIYFPIKKSIILFGKIKTKLTLISLVGSLCVHRSDVQKNSHHNLNSHPEEKEKKIRLFSCHEKKQSV